MGWKLWLDDQWDDPEMPFRHPPAGFIPARSSQEAIRLTQLHGVPSYISFDHDLGGDDKSTIYVDYLTFERYDEEIPGYQIHSANMVGALNIQSKMESWKRSKEL